MTGDQRLAKQKIFYVSKQPKFCQFFVREYKETMQ